MNYQNSKKNKFKNLVNILINYTNLIYSISVKLRNKRSKRYHQPKND